MHSILFNPLGLVTVVSSNSYHFIPLCILRFSQWYFLWHAANWSWAPTSHYGGGVVCVWVVGTLGQARCQACADISPRHQASDTPIVVSSLVSFPSVLIRQVTFWWSFWWTVNRPKTSNSKEFPKTDGSRDYVIPTKSRTALNGRGLTTSCTGRAPKLTSKPCNGNAGVNWHRRATLRG